MATLRNTAASPLRLEGLTHIKKTTERTARDRNRTLPLPTIQNNGRYVQ